MHPMAYFLATYTPGSVHESYSYVGESLSIQPKGYLNATYPAGSVGESDSLVDVSQCAPKFHTTYPV